MTNRYRLASFAAALIAPWIITIITTGCSDRTQSSYDELSASGEMEQTVRKRYRSFFNCIDELGSSVEAPPDSGLISRAAKETDEVLEDIAQFPGTIDSRIALDALSYAAAELSESDGFSHEAVRSFRRVGLIEPIVLSGRNYVREEASNISTHLQLVLALQRAIGENGTDELVVEALDLVGPAPSDTVLVVCRDDSLVFRKAFDLVVYSQSRQEYGPPIWMVSGDWLLVFEIENMPFRFYGLKTMMVNEFIYLTFKEFSLGEIYAGVFDDPVPGASDSEKMDAWLSRASEIVQTLKIDESFAGLLKKTTLPMHDVHFFYNDYLVASYADSATKEYEVVFKTERMELGTFEFAGADSLKTLFTDAEIRNTPTIFHQLPAGRHIGATMIGGSWTPAVDANGTAYLIPMGPHDSTKMEKLMSSRMPEISITTE